MPSVEGQDSGLFLIPSSKFRNLGYQCIASAAFGWDHVSVTLKNTKTGKPVQQTPTWMMMCEVKSHFWKDEEYAMQLHPPKKDHINLHDHCLHLWRPQNQDFRLPPSLLV